MTAILVLHGSGESVVKGPAHTFAINLRSVLVNNHLSDTQVIELSLTEDHKKDYYWAANTSMEFQLKKLSQYISDHVLNRLETEVVKRIHLIGCSQGGLLLRALLRTQCLESVEHKIHTMVTLGAPNNGVCGLCPTWKIKNPISRWIYWLVVKRLTRNPTSMDWLFYSQFWTKRYAFSSYWNSPNSPHRSKTFLSMINNENESQPKNYLSEKLERLVVISFECESVVIPPITTAFGYWDSTLKNVIPYTETDFYRNDWFGLRTLDERKGLVFDVIRNRKHLDIPLDYIEKTLLDYLK